MNIRFVTIDNRPIASLKSPGPEGGNVHVPRFGEHVIIGKENYRVELVASYLKTPFTTEPEIFIRLEKVVTK